MRRALIGFISVGLVLLGLAVAEELIVRADSTSPASLSIGPSSDDETDPAASTSYENYSLMSVATEADIVADYERQQTWFTPLLMPDPEYVLVQRGGIMPITDWAGFTKVFVEGLVPVEREGITYWPVWVMEATYSIPRSRVIVSAKNEVIAELSAPKDYDPTWWVRSHYPHLYDGEIEKVNVKAREELETLFDGLHVVMQYDLIDADNLSKLVLTESGAESVDAEKTGGAMMMMWQGGSVTNLEFVDIALSDTNGIAKVVLAYPDDFTNRISVIACTDLLDPDWRLLVTTNPAASTNTITYVNATSTNFDLYFYHAYDADCDTDGDGVVDGVERFMDGTDPDNPNDPPNVKGTVSYSGRQNGPIFVVAATTSNSWATNSSTLLSGPGNYLVTKLAPGSYYIKGWRDSNTNNAADTNTEAWAQYASNPVTITGAVTNVNFTLSDPDNDADGLPDWWEIRWFGSTNYSGADDPDSDGLTNTFEYMYNFCPTNEADATIDADGDRFQNVYECHYGSDPTNNTSVPSSSNYHYVSLTGSHIPPFTNWATASTNVQTAIDWATNDYDIVMVADGTYKGASNRNLDFAGKKIMVMSAHGSRNCIIDCENAGSGFVFRDYVTTRASVVDGFTIRNGNANENGYGWPSYGGGILILGDGGTIYGSPTIQNCLITSCTASFGGGIATFINLSNNPAFLSCVIVSNTADWAGPEDGGGGILVYGSSALILNCTIANNTNEGIAAYGYPTIIQNCILWGNSSSQLTGTNNSTVQYCDIQAWTGGGTGIITNDPLFVADWRLSPQSPCIDAGITNAVLADWDGESRWDDPNHANTVSSWDIGADEYRADNDSLPDWWEMHWFGTLTNTAAGDFDGDGLNNSNEYAQGTCPIDSDTDADGYGDGIEVSIGTDPLNASSHPVDVSGTIGYSGIQTGSIWVVASLSSTTWSTNYCTSLSSPGAYSITSLPNLTNYWIKAWRDTDGDGSNDYWEASGSYTSSPVLLASDLTGIGIMLSDPTNDTDSDGMPDWWEMRYGLNPSDPSDASQDTDRDGVSNLQECEAQTDPAEGWYVDGQHGSDSAGGSYVSPFLTIRRGINAANASSQGRRVVVLPGLYTGESNKNLVVTNMGVYGNGPSNTIIDCEHYGRGFEAHGTGMVTLAGFTIQNGCETNVIGYYIYNGGAIYSDASYLVVDDCDILNNIAYYYGGGIYASEAASVTIRRCRLVGNNGCPWTSSRDPAATFITTKLLMEDCLIHSNGWPAAYWPTNLIQSQLQTMTLVANPPTEINIVMHRCDVTRNGDPTIPTTTSAATVRTLGAGSMMMVNCIVADNALSGVKPDHIVYMTNCTVVGNGLAQLVSGSGLDVRAAIICNSIVWKNSPEQILANNPSLVSVDHSMVNGWLTGWIDGGGNISLYPSLLPNYRLGSGSPCIDTGTNLSWMAATTDIDGASRVVNGCVDMGASEFGAGDTDYDGLPDWWEREYFGDTTTAVATDDSDGDGYTNLEEYLAGTNPNDPTSHPWRNISGTISYSGPQTGTFWVVVTTSSNSWSPAAYVTLSNVGSYVITHLSSNMNYWVKVWRDTDGNGSNTAWEAQGSYTNNPVYLTNDLFNINIVFADPTSPDGLPDWWKVRWFTNLNESATNDPDGDGLTNLQEYQLGTCPTNSDTDTDAYNDGFEVRVGTDPLDAASHPADIYGTISYAGNQPGQIWVIAVTNGDSWATNYGFALSCPGAYSITNIPNLNDYWIKAWRELGTNNTMDSWEAQGCYSNNSIFLITNVSNIVTVLIDPDVNGDNISDWKEISIVDANAHDNIQKIDQVLGRDDFDGDGVSNEDEIRLGTDPTSSNSYPQRITFAASEQTVVTSTNDTCATITVILAADSSNTASHSVTCRVYVAGGTAGNGVDYIYSNTNVWFTSCTTQQLNMSICGAPWEMRRPRKDVLLMFDQITGPAVRGQIDKHCVHIDHGEGPDSNTNGIPNWWEKKYYTNDTGAVWWTTNATGWNNLETYLRGANPTNVLVTDANNVLQLQLMTPLRR